MYTLEATLNPVTKDALLRVLLNEKMQTTLSRSIKCIENTQKFGGDIWLFTKLVKVLLCEQRKRHHQIVAYNDCLILGYNEQECRLSVRATTEISERAGFIIHPVKSVVSNDSFSSSQYFKYNEKDLQWACQPCNNTFFQLVLFKLHISSIHQSKKIFATPLSAGFSSYFF